MNTQTLPLVNFEQAKALKESKFDWKVMNYFHVDFINLEGYEPNERYSGIGQNYNDYDRGDHTYFSRPTVALALRWLREVKGIFIFIDYDDGLLRATLFDMNKSEYGHSDWFPHYEYDQAESAALSKALTILN